MPSVRKILIALLLNLSLAGSSVFADEPVQPYLEAPFAERVINRTTKEEMPPGNWAFDVSIENPNNRDLFCRGVTLTARLGVYTEQCSRADYATYIPIGPDGQSGIIVKARDTYSLKEAGFSEREAKSEATGKVLEFCGADTSKLNCGFFCANGRAYGDEWTEQINGNGYKKYICDANGQSQLTETFCDATHRAGESWEVVEGTRVRTNTCQIGGGITSTVGCLDKPLHLLNGEGSCVPAPCDGTQHGSSAKTSDSPNGKIVSRCDFGQWVEPRLECNPGASLIDGACVLNCGSRIHGSVWTEVGACSAACKQTVTKFVCEAGFSRSLEAKLSYCPPRAGQRCAGISGNPEL